MLYAIAVIVSIMWPLGLVSGYTLGAFVHLLLAIAVVLFLAGLRRGRSRFNFFYQNCSDQAKGIFDLILPHTTGDRTSGITT